MEVSDSLDDGALGKNWGELVAWIMLGSGGGVFSELVLLVVFFLSFDFGSKFRSEDVEMLPRKRPFSATAVSEVDFICFFSLFSFLGFEKWGGFGFERGERKGKGKGFC